MNASEALATAREYLNDNAATLWTDAVLMPKLRIAHRMLQVKLQLAGIPVIKARTITLTIPKGTTDFSTIAGYPTDLVEPKWMKERAVNQLDRDFIDMQQVDWVPNMDQTTELIWWCWQGEKILFLGSTADRQVQLRYVRGIPIPAAASDPLGFLFAENYLGPKTAALAASHTEDALGVQEWNADANEAVSDIVRMNIRGLQNLPARQRPYHRGRGRTRALRDF